MNVLESPRGPRKRRAVKSTQFVVYSILLLSFYCYGFTHCIYFPNNASIEGVLAVLIGGRWSSLATGWASRYSKLLQITAPGALTFKNTQ